MVKENIPSAAKKIIILYILNPYPYYIICARVLIFALNPAVGRKLRGACWSNT